MKIIQLFLILVILQIANVCLGQEAVKRTHLGFSVTPQFSLQPQGASHVEGDKFRFCFAVGGDIYYDLSPNFQLKSGLSFLQSNINYRDYSPQFPGDVEDGVGQPYKSYWSFNLTQSFIGLPLEAKVKFGPPEKVNHFFLSAGVRFQYLLKTDGTVHLVESGNPQAEQDLDSFVFEFNDFWTLLSAGFGYEWQVGKRKLAINPVFDYSLTKIFKEDFSARDNGTVEFFGLRLAYY
jgi:hypothetical protein